MRMRNTIGAFTLAALAVVTLSFAQSAGGAFGPTFDYVVSGQWIFSRASSPVCFEGSTNDANETCITPTDPTADRTLTLPNATDTLVGLATTDTLTNKTLTSPTLNLAILASESVTAAGATETLTSADCGQTQLLDTAAGSVVTLPAATGSGCTFRFIVTVTNTSNDHSIVVVGNDNLIGGLLSMGTTADQTDAFSCVVADACDAVQMNGTTEGGIAGTWIVVQDVAADTWAITGVVISTDASATMLASGVVS